MPQLAAALQKFFSGHWCLMATPQGRLWAVAWAGEAFHALAQPALKVLDRIAPSSPLPLRPTLTLGTQSIAHHAPWAQLVALV